MKKKIGDLTLKELSEYCMKKTDCNDCPLLPYCLVKPYRMKNDYFILKEEIEVEDEEKVE